MQLFWMVALAFIVTFAFFLVLGAFDPADVMPWTIAAIVLAVMWIIHGVLMRRHRAGIRAREEIRARERRGF